MQRASYRARRARRRAHRTTRYFFARSGTGLELDVLAVPRRATGMTPYEVMLSESQERMLVVCVPARVADIQAICRKWDLEAAEWIVGHPEAIPQSSRRAIVDRIAGRFVGDLKARLAALPHRAIHNDLNDHNFLLAMQASCSIPFVLQAVIESGDAHVATFNRAGILRQMHKGRRRTD